MRIKTESTEVYKFEELDDAAQDKAIEQIGQFQCEYDWWDSTYEDAERIGLTITSFDCDRAQKIEGKLNENAPIVAEKIISEHGKDCSTFALAESLLRQFHIDNVTSEQEDENEELEKEFERALLEEYLSILTKEYDYLNSREAIIETINANEYEFTEDGRIA